MMVRLSPYLHMVAILDSTMFCTWQYYANIVFCSVLVTFSHSTEAIASVEQQTVTILR